MKSFTAYLFLLCSVSAFTQNQQFVGAWTCGPAEGQSYEKATIYFAADGHYYLVLDYGQNDWEGNPIVEEGMGMYVVNGNSMKIYDLKNDSEREYTWYSTGQTSMQMSGDGYTWNYRYEGNMAMPVVKRQELNSWENYRKLEGCWRSEETVLKFIPSQGLVIIRSTTDPDFFKWGYYSIDGNEMQLKEIGVEETLFYSGHISDFEHSQFGLTAEADDSFEQYNFQGPLGLDASETMMVTEYMNMMHRTNMSIIGAIGGDRYIWKWVDQYGNTVD